MIAVMIVVIIWPAKLTFLRYSFRESSSILGSFPEHNFFISSYRGEGGGGGWGNWDSSLPPSSPR